MSLDLLLVNPNSARKNYQALADKYSAIEPPTWSLLLAGAAQARGYSVQILDCDAERLTPEQAVARIKDAKPKLVAAVSFGQNPNSSTTNMSGVYEICDLLKEEDLDTKVMVLGSHASALPWEVIDHKAVDYVALNEGVYTLLDLLEQLTTSDHLDEDKIPGLFYKKDGLPRYSKTPAKLVETSDMDQVMPGYPWDLLPYRNKPFDLYRAHTWHAEYKNKYRNPFAAIYTSLGCQLKCNFCFPADTNIILAKDRNKKIKDVVIGDKLIGWDENKSDLTETTVVNTIKRKATQLFNIKLKDGKNVRCTAEHPFFKDGKWVMAKDLNLGDQLLVIESSDKVSFRMKNYNPSFDKETALKGAETRRKNGYVPYMCTPEGKAKISAAARKRALSDDNPMKNPEIADKVRKAKLGKNNPGWKHGRFEGYYGNAFAKIKPEILKRDNYTCQECKDNNRKLVVHHIDHNKLNNEPCNLITLCYSCHRICHANDPEKWIKHFNDFILAQGYENCPHYETIESIVIEVGNFEVFNLECSKHNNYFANYFLVHNCMINMVNRTDPSDGVHAGHSNRMRFWSPEWVNRQFDILVQDYGVETIRLVDELFFFNRRYYEPILNYNKEMGYGKNIRMWSYARVDTINPKFLDTFREGGVKWLACGFEAANQNVRREIYKGKFKETNIRSVVQEARDHGLWIGANWIFGHPTETYENMQESLDLAIELNTEFANFYCAAALPGSQLYYHAKEKGWELPAPDKPEGYAFLGYDCLPLPTEHLRSEEVLRFRDEAWHKYFERPEYLSMIERTFGQEARKNIEDQTKIKLKRKLLGD